MKKRIKSAYLILSSVFIALLQLPFAFAKPVLNSFKLSPPSATDSLRTFSEGSANPPFLKSVYDSLHLELKGLSREAFEYAKQGMEKLLGNHMLYNNRVLTVIDFSLPSFKKRMFILDLENYKILFQSLVSHGRNTGKEWANSFSNESQSYKSSPGFYITKETYLGKNGYSLKLEGMETGINDQAYERGIVVHGAPYVSDMIANSGGFVGRSQGCPAVPAPISAPIINTIKNGTCLFIYHPSYVPQSRLLN